MTTPFPSSGQRDPCLPSGPPPRQDSEADPEQGPRRSRANSLQHGLCATALLPEVLGQELLERHRARLLSEWRPTSATQTVLVDELARHAAALERIEQLEAAVLRCGARAVPDFEGVPPELPGAASDLILAGAVSTEALDRVTRYRRAHERGWHATLKRLLESRALEAHLRPPQTPAARPWYTREAECEAYLVRRWQGARRPCPCGHAHAYWLARRRRWQCAGCRRQCGVRTGTLMERSPLPLRLWFTAIALLVQDPRTPLAALAAATGHRRRATLRRLAGKVRAALASDRASQLLAGLEQVFRALGDEEPARSVPDVRHFAERPRTSPDRCYHPEES
jgi:hypothetical protein